MAQILEFFCLSIISGCPEKAYGTGLTTELNKLEHRISPGAIHTVLMRMQAKRWIRASSDESQEASITRPRKHFALTDEGQAVLAHTRALLLFALKIE